MNTASIINRTWALRVGVFVLGVAAATMLAWASSVYAGVGIGVAPTFPSPVTVGDTGLAANIAITNNSTAGDGNPITLSSIKLIPSCGAIVGSACTSLDPGVFSVSAAATGAGDCASSTFTTAITDVPSGEVTFTPNAPIALTPGQICTINFTVGVLKMPTVDATVATGTQTLQLSNVSGNDQLQQPGTGSGSDTTTVNKASPSISTTPSAGGPVGTVLNDTATLSGGSSPTGGVTFKLFPPSDATCSGVASYTDTDPSAPYATSPGFISNAQGVWHWTADYAGDANNNATSSPCSAETATVTQATPTISTTLSTTATTTGASVHDSSTLSGATGDAGGTVTYTVFTNNSCSAGAMDAGTKAVTNGIIPDSNALVFNSAGTFYWQATYSGDAKNAAATSTCQSEVLVVTQPAGQYCSPGYWKQDQHFDSWVGYSPSQTFSSVFGRVITVMWSDKGKPGPVTNPTLLQALQANGGGISMLARVAVDGLLNASALSSGFTTGQVIGIVQGAIDSGNYGAAGQLTAPENCPLN